MSQPDANNAVRDGNHVPTALFQSTTTGLSFPGQIDQTTGRVLVDSAGGGSVTSVSVVSANGLAGTVATPTTTPAITLSTTVNSPVLAGNGTAIAGATTTGTGSTVVLSNSPTLQTVLLKSTDGLGKKILSVSNTAPNEDFQYIADLTAQAGGISNIYFGYNSQITNFEFRSILSGTNVDLVNINASNSASSGNQDMISITPLIQQTGTASYSALTVNPSESTTGSGTNSIASFKVTNSEKFAIRTTGHLLMEGVTSTGATGTGNIVFSASPTLVTPALGVATATSINKMAITAPATSSTLAVADGKTLTASNTITLAAGADSQTFTFPAATATIAGLGTAQTFTGQDKFNNFIDVNNAVTVTSNAGTVPVTFRLNTFTNSSASAMTITLATASAVDGQMTIVRIYDFSGVAEGITWVNTENSTVSVPTTSNGSTTLPLTVGFMYNNSTSKWRCIAVA